MKVNCKLVVLGILTFLPSACLGLAEEKLWLEPRCHPLDIAMAGNMVELSDGSLLAVKDNKSQFSKDDGKTWTQGGALKSGGSEEGIPEEGLLIRTRNNVIILIYTDSKTFKWGWDKSKGEPLDDIRLDVWSIRSLDEGKTWVDRQKIQDGYCGGLITVIQTRTGQIVVPVQNMVRDPGRNVTATYVSDNEGKTWTHSNIIDLGGRGNHDGAFEATLVELRDGRLWMLIRTSLDEFWQAFSSDEGTSWRVIEPSHIDASNSPGYILRLASGRLVLVWNRLNPEGQDRVPRRDADLSERPSSWQRDELSIAFSQDDGNTWNKSAVIARKKQGKFLGGNVSYPFIFERRPGELWIFAGGGLKVSLQEKGFVR